MREHFVYRLMELGVKNHEVNSIRFHLTSELVFVNPDNSRVSVKILRPEVGC